jgi:hypothetical protein
MRVQAVLSWVSHRLCTPSALAFITPSACRRALTVLEHGNGGAFAASGDTRLVMLPPDAALQEGSGGAVALRACAAAAAAEPPLLARVPKGAGVSAAVAASAAPSGCHAAARTAAHSWRADTTISATAHGLLDAAAAKR